jgi:hypothetical protein
MTWCWEGKSFCKLTTWLSSLAVILSVVSCSATVKPITAGITELSACKGWDGSGKPIGIYDVFQPDEDRIYACGYLMTNQPITFQVHWYYEDELVFTQVGEYGEGYFYSFIEPKGENFPIGRYRIEVVIGKMVIRSTEFRVEKP